MDTSPSERRLGLTIETWVLNSGILGWKNLFDSSVHRKKPYAEICQALDVHIGHCWTRNGQIGIVCAESREVGLTQSVPPTIDLCLDGYKLPRAWPPTHQVNITILNPHFSRGPETQK